MSRKKKIEDIKYQDALTELENIVDAIEEDSLDIDKLSDEVKRALALIEHCRNKLRNTENDIERAFKQNQEPGEEDEE